MEWKPAQKKSEIMPSNMHSISADISINGQKLQEVTSFKYLGAILYKDGTCSAEVHIKIASDMAAMARLSRIWLCNTISFASNFKLYTSLITSILLYGRETWILLADSEERIQTFKTKYLRKLLGISYLEHKTSEWIQSSLGSTGTSSDTYQETGLRMFRACHAP